ncbi:MAG: c-type cytochrome [Gammaproteobacteria bacterium]|nr:c-type cytochrome [Gammaproteobacteria bacterium]
MDWTRILVYITGTIDQGGGGFAGKRFREKNIRLVIAAAALSCCFPCTASLAQDIDAPAEHTRVLADHLKGATRYHVAPGEDTIPNDKYGDDVRLGKKIFTETYRYARRYAGNDLTCANCHLDAGRRPNAGPMWAAYGMYPAYREMNNRNNSLEERIQQCFLFSLNGFAPALDAPELRALVSYIHFLAKGVPIGVGMPGRGYPQVVRTGSDPNPKRGDDIYTAKCAICHGASGAGEKKVGGGYTWPPLWGMDAYNKGAGMANNDLLAGFIKANMPLEQPWSLTDQEALDVAAYINLQIRPYDPRKGLLKGLFD